MHEKTLNIMSNARKNPVNEEFSFIFVTFV